VAYFDILYFLFTSRYHLKLTLRHDKKGFHYTGESAPFFLDTLKTEKIIHIPSLHTQPTSWHCIGGSRNFF